MTNIIILSLAMLTNKTQVTYTAPKGVYQVQYALTNPILVSTNTAWVTIPTKSTNDITEVKTVTFDRIDSNAVSFRMHKIN